MNENEQKAADAILAKIPSAAPDTQALLSGAYAALTQGVINRTTSEPAAPLAPTSKSK